MKSALSGEQSLPPSLAAAPSRRQHFCSTQAATAAVGAISPSSTLTVNTPYQSTGGKFCNQEAGKLWQMPISCQ